MNECQNIKSKIDIEKAIKSFYNLKNIFSFLSEKQKLNMVINNKHLQKKFDIKIEDYKRISERYKVGERNGKGKEYDISTDVMLFEGEYLNGKRNGKGKEYYYEGKLKFKGENLNGKRNGKGTEYYYSDKLEFEGEYLNGKRIGKGKEYDEYSELEFEGEYLNGERNGNGKEYYDDDKKKLEGEYLNEKKRRGKGYKKLN